jgi:Na+/glutamate symporter
MQLRFYSKCAGFLINIVFASLFLGQKIPGAKEVWNKSGPQLMYGMVVAWGQWISGLLVTVGCASAFVTFICLLCTLCTHISRSICNCTHYRCCC